MADFFCLDLRQVLTDVQAEGGKWHENESKTLRTLIVSTINQVLCNPDLSFIVTTINQVLCSTDLSKLLILVTPWTTLASSASRRLSETSNLIFHDCHFVEN